MTVEERVGGGRGVEPPAPGMPDGCCGEVEELYDGLLRRCTRCGWVATANFVVPAYDTGYFTGDEAQGYAFDSPLMQAFDDARFDEELGDLESRGLRGSLLDMGCATGTYLAKAVARGWKAEGVEPAAYARNEAARRSGARVVERSAELGQRRYDVVTLHHVLEHIPDPLSFLRDEVRPHVGGLLLVEVPNFDSLIRRVQGPAWEDMRPTEHVFHYTERTLVPLLEAAGFRVRSVRTRQHSCWTLWNARELVGLLLGRAEPLAPGGSAEPEGGDAGGASEPAPAFQPGPLRRSLTALSRWTLRPAVRRIERSGRGVRLIVEAERDDA